MGQFQALVNTLEGFLVLTTDLQLLRNPKFDVSDQTRRRLSLCNRRLVLGRLHVHPIADFCQRKGALESSSKMPTSSGSPARGCSNQNVDADRVVTKEQQVAIWAALPAINAEALPVPVCDSPHSTYHLIRQSA
jgi:hypothetical protein